MGKKIDWEKLSLHPFVPVDWTGCFRQEMHRLGPREKQKCSLRE